MNISEHYRTTLEELTRERVGGPELETSLAAGRRRRRVRRHLVVGGAASALVVAGLSAAWLQRPHEVVAIDGFSDQPSYQDFVPGTDIDQTLQSTIATHLVGLPAADQVYPSDWNTDGPMPSSQWDDATDWQAVYTVDPNESMTVLMGKKIPGARVALCKPDDQASPDGQPACETTTLPSGGTITASSFDIAIPDHGYQFVTYLTRPDGSTVTVNQHVTADSWAQADARRAYDPETLTSLLTDPAMTFPDPVVTPPPPSNP